MNRIQKFITGIVPRAWAESMEADSRQWMITCSACGAQRSIWEAGGIRWKAVGNSTTITRCFQCGKLVAHTLSKGTAG